MRRVVRPLFRFSLSILVAISSVVAAEAQTAGRNAGPIPTAPQSAGRVLQFEQFIQRWAGEVEARYGVHAEVWRARMAPAFLAADAINVTSALAADSADAALAALRGRSAGRRAASRLNGSLTIDNLSASRLGDVGADMTYTPIVPCRIVDTRSTTPIAANSTRSFLAIMTDYSGQGGNVAGCGIATQVPGAVVLNVTAVAPGGAGFATVYPFDAPARPITSSINYASGAIVNNTVITPVPDPIAFQDFIIYTFAQSHFVVDIVGYFDTPEATPLECVNTANEVTAVGGSASVSATPAASCPAAFQPVGVNCSGSVPQVTLSALTDSTCTVFNTIGSAQSVTVSRRCCRVPGR